MTRATIAGAALAAVLVLIAAVAVYRGLEQGTDPSTTAETPAAAEFHPGFLHGRVTTLDGATFEGRLRFGGTQEAFWGDYFNGARRENPWAANVPPDRLPRETYLIELFGATLDRRERPADLRRRFMVRFGHLVRIEAVGRVVRATLRSGTVVELDRLEAGDFDDGVRVWDVRRGVVDLDSLRIRSIEFLPAPASDALPSRLHGTVRTSQGAFTGFLQWDREECVGSDELDGHNVDGDFRFRFDTLRSIARESEDASRVTLLDGREIVLSAAGEVDLANRGIYVDDPRYGRVLVSREAFERVDFTPGGGGPAYTDFPPGHPLRGSVTHRTGDRLEGRLVFDLDESETVETLDAPSEGVDYTLPFDLVASIALPASEQEPARVALHGGEELRLEREGDLGPNNAGLLVFVDGRERPEYLPWADVARVDFGDPTADR